MTRKRVAIYGVIMIALLSAWFIRSSLRTQKRLVTLSVRNEQLTKVVRTLERQVDCRIFLHGPGTNTVTFTVQDMPLEEVLDIITRQVPSHWTGFAPVYSQRSALAALHDAFENNIAHQPVTGWSSLTATKNTFGPRFAGNPDRSAGSPLALVSRPAPDVLPALSRFAGSRVLLEDGITNLVSLSASPDALSPDEALESFAKQLDCDWARFYRIEVHSLPRFGPGKDGPRFSRMPNLSEEDRKALGEGKRVRVRLGGPSGEGPAAGPEFTEGPDGERAPDPGKMQERIAREMRETILNTTPKQRAERHRSATRMPPPGDAPFRHRETLQ